MLYMVTFTINIPPMLAYMPYMDPMGLVIYHHFAIILNGSYTYLYINFSCLIDMIPSSQRRESQLPGPVDSRFPAFSESQQHAWLLAAVPKMPKQVSMDWFRENLQETMVLPSHIGFPVKFPIIQFCDSNPQRTVMGANLLETIDALWLSLSTILKDHRMSRRYCESSTRLYIMCLSFLQNLVIFVEHIHHILHQHLPTLAATLGSGFFWATKR